MLNSTKTWQEEFKNKFPDKIARVIDDFGDTTKSDLEQFISDLRKRDMEALIGIIPKKKLGHINQEGFCDNCGYKICRCYQTNSIIDTFKKIIKDYYEN